MKNQTHTPGPWHHAPGELIYGPLGESVASCRFVTNFKEENIANMRLISAAPDMLALLELSAERIDFTVKSLSLGHTVSISSLQNCAAEIRAAISKATHPLTPMKTITITVFEFDELSDSAKERAREWCRCGALDYEWWDSIYDDAKRIGLKITSFELDRERSADGEFTKNAQSCAESIIKEHGESCETRKTAEKYINERADLVAKHADIESSNGLTYEGDQAIEDHDTQFLASLLEDYSIMLQNEYEYLLSDAIRCNGFTFTEEGKRV
jgi:hypothetical protein